MNRIKQCVIVLDYCLQSFLVFTMFDGREMSLVQNHPHGDTSVLLNTVCGGEDYRPRNDHKTALEGIQPRDGSLMEGRS